MRKLRGQKVKFATLAIAWLWAELSFARFYHRDADAIDQESELNEETFNHIAAYQYSYPWNLRWLVRQNGFRITAGSLDVNRFYYREEVKFYGGSWLRLKLDRQVQQDYTTHLEQNELQVEVYPLQWLYFAVLGQSDSFKKFGDLGGAMGIRFGALSFLEFYGISVDHYYNSKETITTDNYLTNPVTKGLKWVIFPHSSIFFKGHYELDSKLVWDRKSRGYTYDYEATYIDSLLGLRLGPTAWQFAYQSHNKQEGKEYGEVAAPSFAKHLQRDHQSATAETSIYWDNGSYFGVGYNLVNRTARYTYPTIDPTLVNTEEDQDEEFPEPLEASTDRTDQTVFFKSRFAGREHGFLTGLFVTAHHLTVGTASDTSKEIKWHTAYQYFRGGNLSLQLSANWDIDKIRDNYPYTEKDFEPWDSGSLQFGISF